MAVVCTITPASAQAEETHNTLRFASRAKQVSAPGSNATVALLLDSTHHTCLQVCLLEVFQVPSFSSLATTQMDVFHAPAFSPHTR